MRQLAVGIGVSLVACYAPTPPAGAPCGEHGECPSGLVCSAGACQRTAGSDADAALPRDGTPLLPDGCSDATCDGNDLVGCATRTTCSLGCRTDGGAHCTRVHPSNIERSQVPAPLGDVALLDTGYTLDTTTGMLRVDDQSLDPISLASAAVGGYRVVSVGNFKIDSGVSLRVTGALPLILVVAGNATIDGDIVASGGCIQDLGDPTCGGPGGGSGGVDNVTVATGCGPGAVGFANTISGGFENGGGGGGYGTAGGSAGTGSGSGPIGGDAGSACGADTLVPLQGGGGGGAGGYSTDFGVRFGGRGGGAGGAIQIVVDGTLRATGGISVAGAGGETGTPVAPGSNGSAGDRGGGGGGGAGGAILLEAFAYEVAGTLAANGGGGGGNALDGSGSNRGSGDGTTGLRAIACAPGGAAGSATTHAGGQGGCKDASPGNGGGPNGDRGGGGGAAGRIRIDTRSGDQSGISSTSPQATIGPLELE